MFDHRMSLSDLECVKGKRVSALLHGPKKDFFMAALYKQCVVEFNTKEGQTVKTIHVDHPIDMCLIKTKLFIRNLEGIFVGDSHQN